MGRGVAGSVVVMGVQGAGKSTIGRLLAERLGVPFVDGDTLHPARNVELMASGQPLEDADREPWLHRVGDVLEHHRVSGGVVVACSALKRRYRDILREHDADLWVVELSGPAALITDRVSARTHEYMPAGLLQSQYDILEPLAPDERGVRVSVEPAPAEIADSVVAALALSAQGAG